MKKILTMIIIGLLCLSMFSMFAPQAKATDNTVFEDNFESYNVGTFPSSGGWELIYNGAGTQYQIVTDAYSNSPIKSLQLLGQNGWSANVQRKFTSDSSLLEYEAYMLAQSNTGPANHVGQIAFWNLQGAPWGKRFAVVQFGEDGNLYTAPIHLGPVYVNMGPYQANRWYHVKVLIDRDAGKYSVWIDDALKAADIAIPDTYEINALELESGHAGVTVFFDDVRIFEAESTGTTLTLTAFDESGFPPASINGANKLADIPIKIYTLEGTLVASGFSDSSGTASFSLNEGKYKIVYGSRASGRFGVASKIVDVYGSSLSIDLFCFQVTYHIYQEGGPYELNYIDLDTTSGGYQDTMYVQPGQQINAEFSWWELETVNVPVWLVSAFGSWSPTSTLGNLASGCASPSSHNLYTVPLTFTAPTTPGTYEVRLVGVLDYDWPNSFYTAAHYQPSLGRDTGITVISKALDGPYGIGTIIVGGQQPDFEISVSPTSQSVGREETIEYTITVTSLNGFQSVVSLYVLASYIGLELEFTPPEVTPHPTQDAESSLAITTTDSTPYMTFEIEMFATGGGKTHSYVIGLTVDTRDLARKFFPYMIFDDGETQFPTDFYYDDETIENNPTNYDDTWPTSAYIHMFEGFHKDKEYLAIEYWFYYVRDSKFWDIELPEPLPPCWLAHDHDWESVYIFLLKEGTDFTPYSATYFRHFAIEGIQIVDYYQPIPWERITKVDQTHPVVYVAVGSHASYQSALPIIDIGWPIYTLLDKIPIPEFVNGGQELQYTDFDMIFVSDPYSNWPDAFGECVDAPWARTRWNDPFSYIEYKYYEAGMSVTVASPVDILVIDPVGRRVGFDQVTQQIVNEIPRAVYTGPLYETETLTIPDPLNGEYKIVLTGTEDGSYTLCIAYGTPDDFNTTIYAANISMGQEKVFTTTISQTDLKLYAWQYIFKDDRRGTELRINCEDKYFQFIAPDKDFGIKYDVNMEVLNHIIIICYKDSEMRLITIAVDTKLDFCYAMAWNLQTRKCYLLIDKAGIE